MVPNEFRHGLSEMVGGMPWRLASAERCLVEIAVDKIKSVDLAVATMLHTAGTFVIFCEYLKELMLEVRVLALQIHWSGGELGDSTFHPIFENTLGHDPPQGEAVHL
jgi:hypothetical protein